MSEAYEARHPWRYIALGVMGAAMSLALIAGMLATKAHQRPCHIWLTIPFFTLMSIGCLLIIIDGWRARLIITRDKVIARGTFRKTEIAIDDIRWAQLYPFRWETSGIIHPLKLETGQKTLTINDQMRSRGDDRPPSEVLRPLLRVPIRTGNEV